MADTATTPDAGPKPLVVTVKHLAAELGLAPITVRRQIARGEIAAVRVGRRWLIPLAERNRLTGHTTTPCND